LKQRRAWISSGHMKAARTHGVPMSQATMAVIDELHAFQEKQQAQYRAWCNGQGETYAGAMSEFLFAWRRECVADRDTKSLQDAV
jgi:hypothetical protein